MKKSIVDPEVITNRLREKAIKIDERKILISNFLGSSQEGDIKAGINCKGFGRMRTTAIEPEPGWVKTTLPHEPASFKLGISIKDLELSQIFQSAVCNYNCWFCYVDPRLLRGSFQWARFFSTDELLDMFLIEEVKPKIITLTGGQPDITPEWTPWMMEGLIKKGLENQYYLWLDDNLSTDFAWKYLTNAQWELMKNYKNFGRVGCLKSFCEEGFYENTGLHPKFFIKQIDILNRLIKSGLDIYGYIILTIESLSDIHKKVSDFMDFLQNKIHHNILLRIIPLQIKIYTPTQKKLTKSRENALKNQFVVLSVWQEEIYKRYSRAQILKPIYQIEIG